MRLQFATMWGGEKIFFYRFRANALQMDRLERKEIRKGIKG